MKIEDGTRATILIHFYRAMVGRADVWRMRMDTTTNWAIGTTAAVVSFGLGDRSAPHFVIHLASFLTLIFLMLEARRLTFYHLWQQRALVLERELIAPAARRAPEGEPATASLAALESSLSAQLGKTVPTMSLAKAAARRLRRVYVYLFAAQSAAWLVKLTTQPEPIETASDIVARASVGPLPGEVALAVVAAALVAAACWAAVLGGRRSDASVAGEEGEYEAAG